MTTELSGSAATELTAAVPAGENYPSRPRRRAKGRVGHWIFFAFGLGVFVNVRLVGYISIAELMAAGLIVMLFTQDRLKRFGPEMSRLLKAGAVWAVAAVATDLYRGVEPAFMARGTGRLIAFLLMLMSIYGLLRARPSGLVWLFGGMVVSSIINIFAFRTGEAEFTVMTGQAMESSWERNYAYVTLMAGFWLAAWLFPRRPFLTAGLLAGLGLLNLFEGARNMGGTLLVAGLLAGSLRVMNDVLGMRLARDRLLALKVALVAVACVGTVYGGYKLLAAQGLLGEVAMVKYQTQASGRFGVLLTSRIDFVAGLLAVRDSPFVGYGSWAHDDQGYLRMAYEMADVPFNLSGSMYEFYNRIPAHSALLEAWVEHGLLATGFWWCVLILLVKVYVRGVMIDREYALVSALALAWIGWNILFSPFGGRGVYAVAIAFLALYGESVSRRGKAKNA